jgi:dTDP-4-amino-4,6-dideoxygalactose transaminase
MPFASLPTSARSAYHILPVLLPEASDRLEVIEKLKAKGVQSSIHYPPFWGFSGYKGMFRPEDTPIAAAINPRELTLPLYPTLLNDEVDYVTDALLEALA